MSLPPVEIPLGAMRFNSDSQKLEYFNGDIWVQVNTFNTDLNGGTRGVFMGGSNEPDPSSTYDIIDYVTITTAANAVDFGNLSSARQEGGALSSRQRGIHFGGDPAMNTIEYITIASTGNSTDFGDLSQDESKHGIGVANNTRGVMAHGWATPARVNSMEYITIATTGNGVNFGDTSTQTYDGAGMSSPTRGVMALGSDDGGAPYLNTMEYVTIATIGNARDFGDMVAGNLVSRTGYSSSTHGILHGGYQYPASPNHSNNIEYITIATLGNATDFGDSTHCGYGSGSSSQIRGVQGGGYSNSSPHPIVPTIDYTTIATTGNAEDFGDLGTARKEGGCATDSHGGLGGY